jgi:hypothetical protein
LRYKNGHTVELNPEMIEDSPFDQALDDGPFNERDTAVIRMTTALEPVDELPPGVSAELLIIDGVDKGKTFTLDEPYMTLGRNPVNDIVISDAAISGTHIAICFAKTREWRIQDLKSTNGTLLNGSRVQEFALRSGDKLIVGDTLLQFNVR